MISGFDCETITDFRLFNTGAFDNTPWQQALGELLLRLTYLDTCGIARLKDGNGNV